MVGNNYIMRNVKCNENSIHRNVDGIFNCGKFVLQDFIEYNYTLALLSD